MHKLTAADFADTGQWKLTVNITKTGLEAVLENTVHEDVEPQPLCRVEWGQPEDHELLEKIENTVYDNPRLLDDFSTKIVLFDPKTLFIPTEIAEESTGSEEEYHGRIYSCERNDVMSAHDRDVTATWSFAPGVRSFLYRTFPGARITCNLLERVRESRKPGEGTCLNISRRDKEADLILTDGDLLLSAATHECRNSEDLSRLIKNLLDAYGLNPENVKIKMN